MSAFSIASTPACSPGFRPGQPEPSHLEGEPPRVKRGRPLRDADVELPLALAIAFVGLREELLVNVGDAMATAAQRQLATFCEVLRRL